jgi:hypothetical protein
LPAILVAQRCSAPCLCTNDYCTIFLRVNSSLSSHSARRHNNLGKRKRSRKKKRKKEGKKEKREQDSIKVSFRSLSSETTTVTQTDNRGTSCKTFACEQLLQVLVNQSDIPIHSSTRLGPYPTQRDSRCSRCIPIELQPKPPTSIGYFNICVASFDLVANRCNPVCGLLGPPVYSLAALCCLGLSCALRSQTPAIGPSSAAVNRLLSLRYSSFSPCISRRRTSQLTRLVPTPKDSWFWRSLNQPLNNQPKPPVLQPLPSATRTNPIPPGTGPLCMWNPLPLSRSAPPRGSLSLVHRTPDLFTPP